MKSLSLSSSNKSSSFTCWTFRPILLLLLMQLLLLLLPTATCSLCSSSTSFHKHPNKINKGSSLSPNDHKHSKKFKLIQVQIIHRHGDRTPITPMVDRDYWQETLPSPDLLSKIAQGTRIIFGGGGQDDDSTSTMVVSHAAGGIGPFGKLTKLGLLQMVQLGSRIREELHLDQEEEEKNNDYNDLVVDGEKPEFVEEHGNVNVNDAKLFTHTDPIHPSKIKIKSTNFPRTIQSVQALLLGLFPLGYDGEIEIDATGTDVLIPDPQPRLSVEQVELERELSQRRHIVEREEELEELTGKITDSLYHLIDWEHASGASWGIGEERNVVEHKDGSTDGDSALTRRRWLTFSQLAEVMTCLRVRDKLPESISHEDYKVIASHSAWKWFENLRNDNLARLAMKSFMNLIMETLRDGLEENRKDPVLYIYSCHDSSLIGLMCAFRLEQPAEWPEYGSYLKVELFKSQEEKEDDGEVIVDYYVRFSLNGQVLKSSWGMEQDGSNKNEQPTREMICLKHLSRSIAREHGHPCIMEKTKGSHQT